MRYLTMVTSNAVKLRNAQSALSKFGVAVVQENIDIPELQSDDVVEIAEAAARYACDLCHATVIKTDVAFEIRALNGFPGPFVKYVNNWLPPEKILRLMQEEADRYAQFVDAVALCDPDQGCISFVSTTPGQIAKRVQGENGWGMDQIFIPDGYAKTLASFSDDQKNDVWNKSQWEQLGMYLQKDLA